MRWMMVSGIIALIMTGGCVSMEQAQQTLIGEINGGLTRLAEWQEDRQELIAGFYRQQREMLDEGFDDDVKSSERLEADWVIAHRRGYVAGLEAIWVAQKQSELSYQRAREDLRAIGDGLGLLRRMSELRAGWMSMFFRDGGE